MDGAFSRLMDVLTGGAFLAGLGLLAGADNFSLGVLAALPFLAQVAQVPALALLLRIHERRAVVLWTAGAARMVLAVVAALLWLRPGSLTPTVLVSLLAVGALLTVTATAAWNWWMRDLLPSDRLGAFFGARMRGMTAVAMVALLAAGWGLDVLVRWGAETQGYALLFTLGALCGFAGLWFVHRTPHVRPPPSPPAKASLRLLPQALARHETRATLAALSTVSAAVTFSLPFVAVFLLRDLGYSYLLVTALALLSQAGYLAGLRGWGYLSDRHGDRGVLSISMAILASCMGGWALAGQNGGVGVVSWIAFLHFCTGFALGGADLAGTNLMLKSAPAHHAQAHLAAIGLGKAALAGVGTLAAGWLWDQMGPGVLWGIRLPGLGGWDLHAFQALSLAAMALTLAALAALARVREERAVPVVEVARTMRREVQQMSSIAGIRVFIHAVSYSVELMAAPFAARPRPRAGLRRRGRAREPGPP
jgi:MFS family permease